MAKQRGNKNGALSEEMGGGAGNLTDHTARQLEILYGCQLSN